MTFDKFGRSLTHPYHVNKKFKKDHTDDPPISKTTAVKLSYYCILPMIGEDENNFVKLSNGEERGCYIINGEGPTLVFPLPESEVTSVHCPRSLEFLINKNKFSVDDLIGQKLVKGDTISLIKESSTKSKLPLTLFLGLVLKCTAESETVL